MQFYIFLVQPLLFVVEIVSLLDGLDLYKYSNQYPNVIYTITKPQMA